MTRNKTLNEAMHRPIGDPLLAVDHSLANLPVEVQAHIGSTLGPASEAAIAAPGGPGTFSASDPLSRYGDMLPGVWRDLDGLRAARGRGLPTWPAWCFLPIAATMGYLANRYASHYGEIDSGGDSPTSAESFAAMYAARFTALYAWRATKGIYRFDPDLYLAVANTPLDSPIPIELLDRLPEWCCFIETPNLAFTLPGLESDPPTKIHGFFVHLEDDANTHRKELRFVVHHDYATLLPIPLHLTAPTLSECFEAAKTEAIANLPQYLGFSAEGINTLYEATRSLLAPLLSLTLYLCSEAAELRESRSGASWPIRPQMAKTKNGPRIMPPSAVRVWETGYRIGAALRAALLKPTEPDDPSTGTHARPRPHIRRAHWHHFWTGPRDQAADRRLILRWLPPVPIATTDPDALIATFHDA